MLPEAEAREKGEGLSTVNYKIRYSYLIVWSRQEARKITVEDIWDFI